MGERVNGLPRPCEPPDHTGRAATTRPLQHPSSSSDSPSNRQTARPLNYLTDRIYSWLFRADSREYSDHSSARYSLFENAAGFSVIIEFDRI